ncbi:hypothetical protein NEMBOFW57_004615 [Staphylotrichum longicolle]|uniref:Uncharacterized protein n=1 Tax=Staphylotrichum longicolle TaxID=669026 RepID=A0AAD4I5T1_9PEZI|nr:hypothetical protein NEMBOFW57_004615 [Staphylotrichum longicolle]
MSQDQSTNTLASAASPPWGSLPVEQYLLRQRLVEAFIQADSVAVADAEQLPPSESQIRTILEPWRSQKLRQLAQKHLAYGEHGPEGDFYFLRTHYAGGAEDDAKLRAWLDLDEEEFIELPREDEWWVVLDDAAMFDLGDNEGDWQQVYRVFPELAAPRLERSIAEVGSDLYYIRKRLKWLVPEGEPQEEDWAEAVRQNVHIWGNRLLVVDRVAFETDDLGLVFRDVKGNVVREGRVRADELNELNLYQNVKGALRETRFWLNSEVGEKYRVGGEVVRELVPLAKAGWGEPNHPILGRYDRAD